MCQTKSCEHNKYTWRIVTWACITCPTFQALSLYRVSYFNETTVIDDQWVHSKIKSTNSFHFQETKHAQYMYLVNATTEVK